MPRAPLPPATVRVARAAVPNGNRSRRVAAALDRLVTDDALGTLGPTHGPPACPPWQLALATRLQCADGRSHRQAAEAVRRRRDGPDVRRLERTDPGVDASVLSECRRLIPGAAESLRFATWLTWCRARQRVNARG